MELYHYDSSLCSNNDLKIGVYYDLMSPIGGMMLDDLCQTLCRLLLFTLEYSYVMDSLLQVSFSKPLFLLFSGPLSTLVGYAIAERADFLSVHYKSIEAWDPNAELGKMKALPGSYNKNDVGKINACYLSSIGTSPYAVKGSGKKLMDFIKTFFSDRLFENLGLTSYKLFLNAVKPLNEIYYPLQKFYPCTTKCFPQAFLEKTCVPMVCLYKRDLLTNHSAWIRLDSTNFKFNTQHHIKLDVHAADFQPLIYSYLWTADFDNITSVSKTLEPLELKKLDEMRQHTHKYKPGVTTAFFRRNFNRLVDLVQKERNAGALCPNNMDIFLEIMNKLPLDPHDDEFEHGVLQFLKTCNTVPNSLTTSPERNQDSVKSFVSEGLFTIGTKKTVKSKKPISNNSAQPIPQAAAQPFAQPSEVSQTGQSFETAQSVSAPIAAEEAPIHDEPFQQSHQDLLQFPPIQLFVDQPYFNSAVDQTNSSESLRNLLNDVADNDGQHDDLPHHNEQQQQNDYFQIPPSITGVKRSRGRPKGSFKSKATQENSAGPKYDRLNKQNLLAQAWLLVVAFLKDYSYCNASFSNFYDFASAPNTGLRTSKNGTASASGFKIEEILQVKKFITSAVTDVLFKHDFWATPDDVPQDIIFNLENKVRTDINSGRFANPTGTTMTNLDLNHPWYNFIVQNMGCLENKGRGGNNKDIAKKVLCLLIELTYYSQKGLSRASFDSIFSGLLNNFTDCSAESYNSALSASSAASSTASSAASSAEFDFASSAASLAFGSSSAASSAVGSSSAASYSNINNLDHTNKSLMPLLLTELQPIDFNNDFTGLIELDRPTDFQQNFV